MRGWFWSWTLGIRMGNWHWQLNRLLEMWFWPGGKIRHDQEFRKDQLHPIRRNLGPFIFLEGYKPQFESNNLLDQLAVAAFPSQSQSSKQRSPNMLMPQHVSKETTVPSKAQVLGRRNQIVKLNLHFPGVLWFGKSIIGLSFWAVTSDTSGPWKVTGE